MHSKLRLTERNPRGHDTCHVSISGCATEDCGSGSGVRGGASQWAGESSWLPGARLPGPSSASGARGHLCVSVTRWELLPVSRILECQSG